MQVLHPQGVGRAVPVAKATTATLRRKDNLEACFGFTGWVSY
jgi:hypothetical protein